MGIQLSHGPRLNARTTPRIHRAVKVTVNRMCLDGVSFDGRILTTEAFVSGVLKAFLDVPYDAQLRLMKQVLPDLQKECELVGNDELV